MLKKTKLISLILLSGAFVVPAGASAETAPFKQETNISQQNGKVTCIVEDSFGPVIGASVVIKGTTNGNVTDMDGKVVLEGLKRGDVIQISYIGYLTQEISYSGQADVRVVMKEDTQALDEVVVVGYTSTSKRDLIASVSTVKAEQISNMPVTNITQGLAGRSPGLIVQANGGGVNSKPSISIRGGGSPIYVIDGVIRSADDFANLSADDIEAMSILKDASATAVYGSRATNGIIQVQTKRGKEGRPSVEYDFNLSYSQPSIWPEKMSAYDRALYSNIGRKNDNSEPLYSEEALNAFKTGSDLQNFSNTDWRGLVLNNWAPQSKHSVRVTGGTASNRYYLSLGHIDQNSLYKSDTHWMKRTNFRLAQTSNIEAIGLQINASIDGYRQHQTHPYTSTASDYYGVFSHINNKLPSTPGLNKYGLPYNITDNPVAETASDAGYIRTISNVINGRGELIWTVPWLKELKVRAASNYRYYSNSTKNGEKTRHSTTGIPKTPNMPINRCSAMRTEMAMRLPTRHSWNMPTSLANTLFPVCSVSNNITKRAKAIGCNATTTCSTLTRSSSVMPTRRPTADCWRSRTRMATRPIRLKPSWGAQPGSDR